MSGEKVTYRQLAIQNNIDRCQTADSSRISTIDNACYMHADYAGRQAFNSSILLGCRGVVAHLVRQSTTKSEVRGSNPSPGQDNFSLLLCVHPALNGPATPAVPPTPDPRRRNRGGRQDNCNCNPYLQGHGPPHSAIPNHPQPTSFLSYQTLTVIF
ncbi:hypothetical protein PoB_006050300 [Plakobranchus ocellatus]|uniref:Uncharacterized protein n=1 Tax=Plakobranchus ocellatus TaxID=259542 RepID=A0AAV4CQ17_9GAST|nr:hypothetical protein PoB_006050300 [Plakobranchus ocellatus]